MDDIIEKLMKYIHYVCGFFVTMCSYFLGGYDAAIQTLATAVFIDYLTGLLAAYVLRKLDSKIGRKGIIKKLGIFLAVAVAELIDQISNAGGSIRLVIISCYVGVEGKSAIENLAQAGVWIPPKLKKALKQLNEDESDS